MFSNICLLPVSKFTLCVVAVCRVALPFSVFSFFRFGSVSTASRAMIQFHSCIYRLWYAKHSPSFALCDPRVTHAEVDCMSENTIWELMTHRSTYTYLCPPLDAIVALRSLHVFVFSYSYWLLEYRNVLLDRRLLYHRIYIHAIEPGWCRILRFPRIYHRLNSINMDLSSMSFNYPFFNFFHWLGLFFKRFQRKSTVFRCLTRVWHSILSKGRPT